MRKLYSTQNDYIKITVKIIYHNSSKRDSKL